ncbi:nucleoside monophosphate kinase [Mycoplasmoides genitalium]
MVAQFNKFIILGPPGAGKGTVCKLLSKTTKLVHIASGDLFREAIKNQSAVGRKIAAIISQGGYVDDATTNQLVYEYITTNPLPNGFILDGYPRTENQLDFLNIKLTIDMVFELVVSDLNKLITRIDNRVICNNCNSVYNLLFQKPLVENSCDQCSAKLVKRSDDNKAVVKARMELYQQTIQPIHTYFFNKQLLVQIDCFLPLEEQLKTIKQFIR